MRQTPGLHPLRPTPEVGQSPPRARRCAVAAPDAGPTSGSRASTVPGSSSRSPPRRMRSQVDDRLVASSRSPAAAAKSLSSVTSRSTATIRCTSVVTSTTAGNRIDGVRAPAVVGVDSPSRARMRLTLLRGRSRHTGRDRRQIRQPTPPFGQPAPGDQWRTAPRESLGAVSAGSGGRIRTYDLWVMRRSSIVAAISERRRRFRVRPAPPARRPAGWRTPSQPAPSCYSLSVTSTVTTAVTIDRCCNRGASDTRLAVSLPCHSASPQVTRHAVVE